jgi:DNA (cytosine-5)-methyltransferase 1
MEGLKLNFIDFFGGAGFIRKGMEKAGHKCVGYCEIDKFAVKSYYAIYGQSEDEWYEKDVRAADPDRMPTAECYCAGFPCQTFSIAGKRGGFEDMRGTLVFEIFRLANIKKPRILFLENVEGLLNHDNGRTFGTILAAMDELGYDAQWQLLNSRYFGVAQNRERVYVVGHLRGTSRPEVFPIYGTDSKNTEIGIQMICDDGPGHKWHFKNNITPPLRANGGGDKPGIMIIDKTGKPKNKDYASCLTGGGHSGGNHSDMDLLVFQKTHGCTTTIKNNETGTLQAARLDKIPCIEVSAVLTPDREEKRQNGRRIKNPGEPMFTLAAQDKHGVYYENCIRRLTERECFRLQGASDEDFDKAAKVNSPSQLYKQAGNGATINVIYEIAKRLEVT